MLKTLLVSLMPGLALAQTAQPDPVPPARGVASIGFGVGNGVALQFHYQAAHWLAIGRVRGKWWGPEAGPKAALFGDDINTYSHQTEAALLLGLPIKAGRSMFYAATGVAYLSGRQLGEYRYSLRKSGLISTDATHYYAYRDYQAVGLPLEVGWQAPPLSGGNLRLGLTGQANLNPQHSVYCVLFTVAGLVSPK